MKNQFIYGLAILLFATLLFAFKSVGQSYEHEMKFAFEIDGCKVYRFKSFDGLTDKTHYFSSCKGNTIDPDEFNFTEVENYEKRRH